MNCCRERPQLVPRYMAAAHGELRELLGRVLGEVATQTMDADLTEMAGDQAPEVRASAARALGNARPKIAPPVLAEMVKDPVWFVRLRATVALGQLRTVRAISALLLALTDSHRLVRLRVDGSQSGLPGRLLGFVAALLLAGGTLFVSGVRL